MARKKNAAKTPPPAPAAEPAPAPPAPPPPQLPPGPGGATIEHKSCFPMTLGLGGVSVVLNPDGTIVGDLPRLMQALYKVPSSPAGGGIGEILLWLVIQEMKRQLIDAHPEPVA